MHSDCTDGLFDIGGLFHTEVIKPNIDLHMDMLPGNIRVPKGGSLEPWSPEISAVEPGALPFY